MQWAELARMLLVQCMLILLLYISLAIALVSDLYVVQSEP